MPKDKDYIQEAIKALSRIHPNHPRYEGVRNIISRLAFLKIGHPYPEKKS